MQPWWLGPCQGAASGVDGLTIDCTWLGGPILAAKSWFGGYTNKEMGAVGSACASHDWAQIPVGVRAEHKLWGLSGLVSA